MTHARSIVVVVAVVVVLAGCFYVPIPPDVDVEPLCCPDYDLSALKRTHRDTSENVDTYVVVERKPRARRSPPSNDHRSLSARNFRGQTQSQYLSYSKQGEPSDTGKAEAESTYDGTRAVVATAGGMGQAQSQSGVGGDCSGCGGMLGPINGYATDAQAQRFGVGDKYVGGRPGAVVGPDGRVIGTGTWSPYPEGNGQHVGLWLPDFHAPVVSVYDAFLVPRPGRPAQRLADGVPSLLNAAYP